MAVRNKNKYTKQLTYALIICWLGASIINFFDWLNSKYIHSLVISILFLAASILNIIGFCKTTKK